MKVIRAVVGALGTIHKLELYLEKEGIEVSVGVPQKVALLGTARMLRDVWRSVWRGCSGVE